MKSSIKGALLSGLVFPGLGQIIQERYRAGIIFIIGAVLGLAGITYSAVTKAIIIMEKIKPQLNAGAHITTQDIIKTAAHIPNGFIDNIGPLLFIGCWLGATIHALFYKSEVLK